MDGKKYERMIYRYAWEDNVFGATEYRRVLKLFMIHAFSAWLYVRVGITE